MRKVNACLALFLLSVTVAVAGAQQAPWPIRAVIVTTFEVGNDTGDVPGEFQLWVEREHLNETLDFPGGVHAIRTNADHTVLGIVSGTTLVNATASLMALGLDPRFRSHPRLLAHQRHCGGRPQRRIHWFCCMGHLCCVRCRARDRCP